jgi:hypothetical protein
MHKAKHKVLKSKGHDFIKWVRWNRCLPSSDSTPTQALGSSGLWSRSCCTLTWFNSPLAAPSSSWVSVYVPFGKSTRIHAYALVYGEGGRITTKPTLVGHIHPDIIIFSQKLLGCMMINKTLLWRWLCAHLSKLGYVTSPNNKGVWLKFKNRTKTWFHNLTP